jgi:hypothetical protein
VTNTQTEVNRRQLLRRGFALEYVTLGWNVVGIVVLAIAAVSARSVALAGFGMDSLIEIGASTVVLWELSVTGPGDAGHRVPRVRAGRKDERRLNQQGKSRPRPLGGIQRLAASPPDGLDSQFR